MEKDKVIDAFQQIYNLAVEEPTYTRAIKIELIARRSLKQLRDERHEASLESKRRDVEPT